VELSLELTGLPVTTKMQDQLRNLSLSKFMSPAAAAVGFAIGYHMQFLFLSICISMALGGGYSEAINAAVNAAIDDVSIISLPLSISPFFSHPSPLSLFLSLSLALSN
jgi:uncharacterized protein (DUF2062 family)